MQTVSWKKCIWKCRLQNITNETFEKSLILKWPLCLLMARPSADQQTERWLCWAPDIYLTGQLINSAPPAPPPTPTPPQRYFFIGVCSLRFDWLQGIRGVDNGLAPNRRKCLTPRHLTCFSNRDHPRLEYGYVITSMFFNGLYTRSSFA